MGVIAYMASVILLSWRDLETSGFVREFCLVVGLMSMASVAMVALMLRVGGHAPALRSPHGGEGKKGKQQLGSVFSQGELGRQLELCGAAGDDRAGMQHNGRTSENLRTSEWRQ
jgi:hypothetical protein